MKTTQPTAAAPANFSFPKNGTIFLARLTLLLLVVVPVAQAETPDDKYLNIFANIAQADSLNANGQSSLARVKYVEAQAALIAFKKDNPLWNPKAVAYRMNYLAEKVAVNSPKSPSAEGVTATAAPGVRSGKNPGVSATTSALKLLSAGAEPRKILRLHPSAGDKQSLSMKTKMAMTMTLSDAPTPEMKLPATQMDLDITVKNVAPNGNITYDLLIGDASVVSDPDVMPQVADAMKSSMSKFRGLSGRGTLSDRGLSLETEIKAPADADAQTRQTLEQMKESLANSAAPLPEEAIGVGARWEMKTKLKSQGMSIDQTTLYELVSVDDGRATLKTTIAQSAANQKIESPAMPGLKVDLVKMTGTGRGTTALDLTKLMPGESNVDAHTEMVMGVNMGGQQQSMTLKLDLTVHLGTN